MVLTSGQDVAMAVSENVSLFATMLYNMQRMRKKPPFGNLSTFVTGHYLFVVFISLDKMLQLAWEARIWTCW